MSVSFIVIYRMGMGISAFRYRTAIFITLTTWTDQTGIRSSVTLVVEDMVGHG